MKTHILPLNDSKVHSLSSECSCHPLCREELAVHHAWDNREKYERQGMTNPAKRWRVVKGIPDSCAKLFQA